MKRSLIALGLVAGLLAAAILAAGGCENRPIDGTGLVKIGKHTYAFIATGPTPVEGHGANSGFVVGTKGVLVVDSRYTPALATELLRAIRTVTAAPILYLVNTHYHPDHAWGNAVFKAQGARIVARPETGEALLKYSSVYLEFYKERSGEAFDLIKDVEVVAPDTTFMDGETYDLGGVTVVLRSFGPGHTAGDCVVVVPRDRVLFTGGLAANGYHINLADPAADFEGWLKTLDALEKLGVRYVVPGQGLVCGTEVLEADKVYIRTLREECVDGIERQVPLEQAITSISVPGTEKYLQPNLLPFNVQAVYRAEIPGVVKPDFAFDLPPEMLIMDGGGSPKIGMIKWAAESREGYREIEVRWEPTTAAEALPQDVADRAAEFAARMKYEMSVGGYSSMEVGGVKSPTAHGTWSVSQEIGKVGGGRWLWALTLRGGKLYSIRMLTDGRNVPANEEKNIEALKKIVETFRITAPGAPKTPA